MIRIGSCSWRTHPALFKSAVYALPERLINAIQKHIPGFFSQTELVFERNLARLGGAGFFLGRPFGHPLLAKREPDRREVAESQASTEELQKSVNRLKELLESDRRERGLSAEQIKQFHEERKLYQAQVQERQASYLGWLVTNPCFDVERRAFFKSWREKGGGNPRLLSLPISIFGELPSIQVKNRDWYFELSAFFQRWCIRSFATCELPILIAPQIAEPTLHHLPSVAEAGMLLFIPWYFLLDRDFKLYELLEHQLLSKGRSHLDSWIHGRSTGWGHTRYARIFELYVYLELGLKQRYPDRIRRKTERLDLAFTDFFSDRLDGVSIDEETVKKTRQEMNRRLGGKGSPTPTSQDG